MWLNMAANAYGLWPQRCKATGFVLKPSQLWQCPTSNQCFRGLTNAKKSNDENALDFKISRDARDIQ